MAPPWHQKPIGGQRLAGAAVEEWREGRIVYLSLPQYSMGDIHDLSVCKETAWSKISSTSCKRVLDLWGETMDIGRKAENSQSKEQYCSERAEHNPHIWPRRILFKQGIPSQDKMTMTPIKGICLFLYFFIICLKTGGSLREKAVSQT